MIETNLRTYKSGFVLGEREFVVSNVHEYYGRAL